MEEKRRNDNYNNTGFEINLKNEAFRNLSYDFNHYNYFYKTDKSSCVNISNVGDFNYYNYDIRFFNYHFQELNSPNDIKFNDVTDVADFERDANLPKVYYFDLDSGNFIRIFHNALIKAVYFKRDKHFEFTFRTGEILTVTECSVIFRDIDCRPHGQTTNYQICEKIFENF